MNSWEHDRERAGFIPHAYRAVGLPSYLAARAYRVKTLKAMPPGVPGRSVIRHSLKLCSSGLFRLIPADTKSRPLIELAYA